MATLKLKKYKDAEEWISKEYPDLFNWPIASGTREVLIDIKPKGISNRGIRKYLRRNTEKSIDYQDVIIENDNRYDLEGGIIGEVKPHHKDRAENIKKKLIEKQDSSSLENNEADQ